MFEAMEFSSFSEFIDMGGYAFNVWSVYALFALFIIANLMLPQIKRKQILREQKRRLLISAEMNEADENDGDSALSTTANGDNL